MPDKKTEGGGGLFGKGNGPFKVEARWAGQFPDKSRPRLTGPLFQGERKPAGAPFFTLSEPELPQRRNTEVAQAEQILAAIPTQLARQLEQNLHQLAQQEVEKYDLAISLFRKAKLDGSTSDQKAQFRRQNQEAQSITSELNALLEKIEAAQTEVFDLLLTIAAPKDIEDEPTATEYLTALMELLIHQMSADNLQLAYILLTEVNTEFFGKDGEPRSAKTITVPLQWPSPKMPRQSIKGTPEQVVLALQKLIDEQRSPKPTSPESAKSNQTTKTQPKTGWSIRDIWGGRKK